MSRSSRGLALSNTIWVQVFLEFVNTGLLALPLKSRFPEPGPSSCSAAALSVRPLQAPLPLLVNAGPAGTFHFHICYHTHTELSYCGGEISLLGRPDLQSAPSLLRFSEHTQFPKKAQVPSTSKLEPVPEIREN